MTTDLNWKLLSDPMNRRILSILNNGSQTPGEIKKILQGSEFGTVSSSRLSNHLEKLSAANLIGKNPSIGNTTYFFNKRVLEPNLAWLKTIMSLNSP